MIINFIKGVKTAGVDDVIKAVSGEVRMNEGFIRQCLNHLTSKDVLKMRGKHLREVYSWAGIESEPVAKILKDLYGEDEDKNPAKVQEYHSSYGFNILIGSVAKWTDLDGRLVREYDIDRLWLCRYVDFLDKAREWNAWSESDRAIATKRIAEMKAKQEMAKAKGKHKH